MIRAVLLSAFAAGSLFAADLTGRWSGAVLPGNNADSVPISFELRQRGNRIIGVAITNESGVCELLNGAVAGPKINFDIQVDKEVVHFELTVAGNKLSGQALGKRDDGGEDGPVAVSIEREDPSHSGPFSGTWSGTAEGVDNGQKRFEYFTITLRQVGADVSGSITDPAGNEHPLKAVKATGSQITFEVDRLQASLTMNGDKMSGAGTVETGGGEQSLRLALTRERPAASGPVGRWAGVGESAENGTTKRFPIYFHLEQTAAGLTGKCIDAEGKAFDIASGVVHGNKISFDVTSGTDRMHFELTIDGDEMTGAGVWASSNNLVKVSAVRRMQ